MENGVGAGSQELSSLGYDLKCMFLNPFFFSYPRYASSLCLLSLSAYTVVSLLTFPFQNILLGEVIRVAVLTLKQGIAIPSLPEWVNNRFVMRINICHHRKQGREQLDKGPSSS